MWLDYFISGALGFGLALKWLNRLRYSKASFGQAPHMIFELIFRYFLRLLW